MNKFLLVRYAPGSGGKFLSCCLQLSPSVNCWDPTLEQIKNSSADLILKWFHKHFTQDWINYLKLEPEVPYKLDFISNRFDRGNEVDIATLLKKIQQNHDQYFLDHYYNNKNIVLILNKSTIPAAFLDQCSVVNMLIENRLARSWVSRARYRKLYYEKEPGLFIIKQDHPAYCSDKRSIIAKKYNNVTEIQTTKYKFIKDYILNDPLTQVFSDIESITQDSSNINQPQYKFDVSSLNNSDILYKSLIQLFDELQLLPPDYSILQDLCKFYVKVNQ